VCESEVAVEGLGKANWGATFEGKSLRPGVIAGLKSPPYITLFCFFLPYPPSWSTCLQTMRNNQLVPTSVLIPSVAGPSVV
jgi:hypothetical protein